MSVKGRSTEAEDRLGRVAAGRSDRNVIILLKVDPRVLLRRVVGSTEQLLLGARVRGTNDVFSIAPLAVARAAGKVATTAGTSSTTSANIEGTAISVGVEAAAALGRTGASSNPASLAGSRASSIKGRARGTTWATSPVSASSTASIEIVVSDKHVSLSPIPLNNLKSAAFSVQPNKTAL